MTKGAAEGLLFCTNVLIPSLFPFMVLASFIVKCGASDKLSFFLAPITTKLFKLPACAGMSILLSLIGGYPVGARGIMSLWEEKKITVLQAKRMSMFMVGGGPAFIIFVVGDSLLKERTLGVILWISGICAQLILAFILAAIAKTKKPEKEKSCNTKALPVSTALVQSCADGVQGLLSMCGLVVLFSAMFGILNNIGADKLVEEALLFFCADKAAATSVFSVLWEVTKGCSVACKNGAPIFLTAFAIGWGGVCVHFQVYAVVERLGISKLKFTLCRLAQGILTAIFASICLMVYTPTQQMYSNINFAQAEISAKTYMGSAALIVMSILFLITVKLPAKTQVVTGNRK
ncbi:hypothetical protein AGMMS50284_4160 [Clostridia bacterium]|nr:hypothetical protein AGMMS50284_4160 [Clostridia bacterium]